MITQAQIEKVRQTIIQVEQPEKVILFGSYAYGVPKKNSDLDILVINNYDTPRRKRGASTRKALAYIRFPLEILFYKQEEIDKWSNINKAFITEVTQKGKILYERKK